MENWQKIKTTKKNTTGKKQLEVDSRRKREGKNCKYSQAVKF